jgi:hypothetical protein
VNSLVVIVASVLCVVGASATLAVALGRAAARDEELARELARDREPSLLYETFSVPSIPAWRWPGTEQ